MIHPRLQLAWKLPYPPESKFKSSMNTIAPAAKYQLVQKRERIAFFLLAHEDDVMLSQIWFTISCRNNCNVTLSPLVMSSHTSSKRLEICLSSSNLKFIITISFSNIAKITKISLFYNEVSASRQICQIFVREKRYYLPKFQNNVWILLGDGIKHMNSDLQL